MSYVFVCRFLCASFGGSSETVLGFPLRSAMVLVTVSVHKRGLHPMEGVKAWHMHTRDDMSLDAILAEGECLNMEMRKPGRHALWAAINRVSQMSAGDLLPQSRYSNCGRRRALSDDDTDRIVDFVKKWRSKRFCTCNYIKHELGLAVAARTVNNVLNEKGYFWRQVPKVHGLSEEQLAKRKEFADRYRSKTPAWWEEHMHMVLDGVTLTMPPKPMSGRQKHAAQRITSMWMCTGEAFDNDVHTFNRYGVQLGQKIPLWGGFSGNGQFTLRLWTPKPKMTTLEWHALVPDVKAAVDNAYGDDAPVTAKVWHDNERFLCCPDIYRENGLESVRFPPNSGDLNPIETVWAWLRKDLAKREIADLDAGRFLTAQQFKQRCAQILHTYTLPKGHDGLSRIQRLVRGMPGRLRRCIANRYGRCGK